MQNLTMGQHFDESDIIVALDKAGALDLINEFEGFLQYKIESKGLNLSEGQKQKLAFARALITSPEILLLDEITSNMDKLSESKIYQTIQNLQNIIVIIVAHRLEFMKYCEKVYFIHEGTIVESGSYDQLIQNRKQFYHLLHSQNYQN